MKKISGPQVVSNTEAAQLPLPAETHEALGELVGAAREGLLALSVGVGLRVVDGSRGRPGCRPDAEVHRRIVCRPRRFRTQETDSNRA